MKVFERQLVHILGLAALLGAAAWISTFPGYQTGTAFGVATALWLTLSILFTIVHQLWVLIFWRLELHYAAVSRWLGPAGFWLYAVGFSVLILSRPVLLVILASANAETLSISPAVAWLLAGVISLVVLYVFYSVVRYFGLKRALGADHFDPSYRQQPLEDRGSFGLIQNSMYVLGLLALWLPGLLWRSKAALLAAAFQHSYIWIHYFTVELPDMRHIYGKAENERPISPESEAR